MVSMKKMCDYHTGDAYIGKNEEIKKTIYINIKSNYEL